MRLVSLILGNKDVGQFQKGCTRPGRFSQPIGLLDLYPCEPSSIEWATNMRITGGLLDCLRWKSYQCAALVPYDFASLQFRVFSIQHLDLGAYSYSLSGTSLSLP